MPVLKSMGFQRKIVLSYLVMMLLIGCVAVLFSYQMTNVTTEQIYLTKQVLPQASALLNVKNQLYTKTYALKMYISTRKPEYLEEYNAQFITKQNFQQIKKTAANAELFTVIDLISDLDFVFLNQINPLLKAGNIEAADLIVKQNVQPRIDKLEKSLALSLHTLEKNTNDEFHRANQSLKVSLIVTYSVSVLSILFGLFCSLYFRKELLRPIYSLMEQVRVVSRGTFGKQITYDVKDEFHELAQEFNKMSLNVKRLFWQVQEQNEVLQAEKRVREQILHSLPVGVITRLDVTSEVHINAKARELVALDNNGLPHSQDPTVWLHRANQDGSADDPWFENKKVTLYRKDGSSFLALVSYVPLLNQQRKKEGWLVVLSDITEQERVQEYIHQSEKLAMVGQLAAGAAHEIRNPLAVIFGFIQLMTSSLPDEQNQRFQLPLVLSEIARINKIVTELLLLSKPSSPNYREVTLTDIFSSILPLMYGEASLHGVEIVERYEKDIPLHVDVEQLKQVLLNLMKNAMEAMPAGGTLTISSTHDEDNIQITVADTGLGIPAEHVARIFDPFFSLKEEGTGLGLPISMRMMKNHGGDIHVKSEPGRGTEMIICLPIKPA